MGLGATRSLTLLASRCYVSSRNVSNTPKNQYRPRTLPTKPPTPAKGVAGTPKVSIVRERSQLMRLIRLVRPQHQRTTTEGVPRSRIKAGGLEINSFPHRIPQLRLPDMGMATQVSAAGCSYWGRRLFNIPIAHQGHGHTRGGSVEERSDQPGRSAPDLHSAKGDQNRGEREGQGSDIQRPSEAAPERTSGGAQAGGDTHNLIQSRGEPWCSGYTIVHIDHH